MGEWNGKYKTEINAAAKKYGVDPLLVAAIIYAESNFNPNAGSSAGAKGLMQLMPGTFKAYGSGDIKNPKDNVLAGTRYISIQLKAFGKTDLALAAYNAGPGNVKKYNGIPPFKETQAYVKKVMAKWKEYGGKGESIVDGAAAAASNATTSGNETLNKIFKSPVLWVSLLIAFLIK